MNVIDFLIYTLLFKEYQCTSYISSAKWWDDSERLRALRIAELWISHRVYVLANCSFLSRSKPSKLFKKLWIIFEQFYLLRTILEYFFRTTRALMTTFSCSKDSMICSLLFFYIIFNNSSSLSRSMSTTFVSSMLTLICPWSLQYLFNNLIN